MDGWMDGWTDPPNGGLISCTRACVHVHVHIHVLHTHLLPLTSNASKDRLPKGQCNFTSGLQDTPEH